MTIVVTLPSFSVIIGPWALASLVRDLWGWSPSSKRFPMIRKGFGPGGSLLWFGLVIGIIWKVLIKIQVRQRPITQLKISISLSTLNLTEERTKPWQNVTATRSSFIDKEAKLARKAAPHNDIYLFVYYYYIYIYIYIYFHNKPQSPYLISDF